MRKGLRFVLFVLMVIALPASAPACFECCSPPPYTRSMCCESICGGATCETVSGATYSFCAPEGTCSQNRIYCAPRPEPGPEIPPYWTRCEPPLSERSVLKSIEVARPPQSRATRRG